MVNLTDNLGISWGFVGADRRGSVQAHALNCVLQKSLCRSGIAPRRQAKVNHLTVRIHRPPQIAPLAADADIGLVDMPI